MLPFLGVISRTATISSDMLMSLASIRLSGTNTQLLKTSARWVILAPVIYQLFERSRAYRLYTEDATRSSSQLYHTAVGENYENKFNGKNKHYNFSFVYVMRLYSSADMNH